MAILLLYGVCMLVAVRALHGGSSGDHASREALRRLPPLISLHDFWSNSVEKWNFRPSPDGERLAWLGDDVAGESAIIYRLLASEKESAIKLGRPLEDFWWAQDSRHILFMWDDYGDENYHLLMADTDHPGSPYVDLTPHPGVRVLFVQEFPSDPEYMLIQHNRRNRAALDLYRLNIYTREETLVAENPGDVLDWITDPNGRLLARRRRDDKSGDWVMELLDQKAGAWTLGFAGVEEDEFKIIGYPLDTHDVQALSGRGRDRTSLVQIDLATGQETIIYEDPRVDLEDAWTRDGTNQLMAAYSCPDYWKVNYFDPELEKVMKRFAKGGRRYAELFDWTRDERLWIILVESDTEAEAWYLYDKETEQEQLLFRSDVAIYKERFAPMQPIKFSAQDGLAIHGYLTIPVGSAGTNLPMVVLVHDGPWERVYWGWNREAQLLANRGYAVLEVNFRGSSGYGKRFMRAGIGGFAGAMHSDILDAVSWTVSEGIADPSRVAIYGWGYGGYAALVGATYTPGVFAAAIDAAGTTDWERALKTMPPYMQNTAFDLQTYLGDPTTSEGLAALRRASPIHDLDQIVRPLLVVQGDNDPWGIQAQVEDLVSRLRERNAPVEYLLLKDEGRSIQNWENHLRFYRALERFLAANLGGRVSLITADEMWYELQ